MIKSSVGKPVRIFVWLILIGLPAIVFQHCQSSTREESNQSERPNVILIVADDMGVGDLASSNGGKSRTPTLDTFFNQGVSFTQAYSASSVCAPARAALLTGCYPHSTGVVTLNMNRFPSLTSLYKTRTTLADLFHTNEYATALVGKWHLGNGADYHPMRRGFESFVGFKDADVTTYYDYNLDVNGKYQHMQGVYLTDVLTDHAIDFIKEKKDSPFFLKLAYYSPHRPLGAPEDVINYYLQQGFDENTAKIYAMIEIMDKGIGKLLEELDKQGIMEQTIVIFTSDNGPDPLTGTRFNSNLKGTKYTVYEGGIRVPLAFAWKGRFATTTRAELIHFIDLVPTLVELCGLEVPDSVRFDGISIAKILLEEADDYQQPVRYWQWNRGVPDYTHNAAMREGDWKLVRPFVTRHVPEGESSLPPVLYNLKMNPTETTDYANEFPDEYLRMSVLLEDWCRQMEFERLKNKD
jgi:arylsulfatase A